MTMQGVDMEMMMKILRGEDMEAGGKSGVNAPVHLFSLLQWVTVALLWHIITIIIIFIRFRINLNITNVVTNKVLLKWFHTKKRVSLNIPSLMKSFRIVNKIHCSCTPADNECVILWQSNTSVLTRMIGKSMTVRMFRVGWTCPASHTRANRQGPPLYLLQTEWPV